jgi:hypothetical protein
MKFVKWKIDFIVELEEIIDLVNTLTSLLTNCIAVDRLDYIHKTVIYFYGTYLPSLKGN